MIDEKVNREVAEKVMGWKPNTDGDWDLPNGEWCGWYKEDWNPSERIDHAMMCLEKFDEWRLWKSNGKYAASVMFGFKTRVADTAPMAICLAALEAVKEG